MTSAACREDPTILGYNLMNEPRSQAELYLVVRQTTDGSKQYNISYNPADDLQAWIEDMAAYVKSLDPIHLLQHRWRPETCLRTSPFIPMPHRGPSTCAGYLYQ